MPGKRCGLDTYDEACGTGFPGPACRVLEMKPRRNGPFKVEGEACSRYPPMLISSTSQREVETPKAYTVTGWHQVYREQNICRACSADRNLTRKDAPRRGATTAARHGHATRPWAESQRPRATHVRNHGRRGLQQDVSWGKRPGRRDSTQWTSGASSSRDMIHIASERLRWRDKQTLASRQGTWIVDVTGFGCGGGAPAAAKLFRGGVKIR